MRYSLLFCSLMMTCGLAIESAGAQPASQALPSPVKKGGQPLMQTFSQRRSTRAFKKQAISSQVLSDLLWAAYGINRQDGKRTVPSTMNWQEIDLYVATQDGLFLYNAKAHALVPVLSKDIRAYTGKQGFVKQAPVVFIMVADHGRMKGVDESRKVFFSAIDAGFISQNVYLFSASQGLGTVVLDYVDKAALHKAMGLKASQKVIVTQPVGFPRS